MSRIFSPASSCILLALAIALSSAPASGQAPSSAPRKAPELSFNVPGSGPQLLSAYHGKVISLEFIYTTCVHCQHASQTQKFMQENFGPKGFQALDIAINPNADLLVENFSKDFGLNFPVGWTTPDRAVSFLQFSPSDRYVVPQIVVIDRKGYIRAQTSVKGDDLKGADAIRMEPALSNLVKSLVNETGSHAPAKH